jgi:hypothetical protein
MGDRRRPAGDRPTPPLFMDLVCCFLRDGKLCHSWDWSPLHVVNAFLMLSPRGCDLQQNPYGDIIPFAD